VSLSPSDILILRADCFKENKPDIIFSFYHPDSEFKKIFNESEYRIHFEKTLKSLIHVGIKIVSEEIVNNLSKVKYIETFVNEENRLLTYYCKAYFKRCDDHWLILKEIKEEIKF
jgi:hypothetical protein